MAEPLKLGKVDTAVPSCACPALRLPEQPGSGQPARLAGSEERGCGNATLINYRAVKAIFNGNFVWRHFGEGHPRATRLCQ